MEFQISLGGKEHGPFTEREVRAYLAYGSMKPDDLVRREGETEWLPAKSVLEFSDFDPDTQLTRTLLTGDKPKPPPRILRYRDYDRVPEERRAARVLWRLFTGLIFRPLTLWRTASVVFTSNIYRRAKDPNGFHRIWPRWVEGVVATLVITHALAWASFIFWAAPRARTLAQVVTEQVQQAVKDVKAAAERGISDGGRP